MWERRDFCLWSRETEVPPAFLLRFADFMFHCRDFAFHLAHPNTVFEATRPVEEINNPARQAAEDDHEKAERTNQDRDAFGHSTNLMEHGLKHFFAKTDAGETDRKSGDRALDRHHGKEIRYVYISAQRERGAEKGREGREMGQQ